MLLGVCVEMRIWHHFVCKYGEGLAAPILNALAAAGLETGELDRSHLATPGIVFFEQFHINLCELLRDLTAGGRNRILVIALTTSACTPDAAWTLLNAGASDVFTWQEASTSAEIVVARLERWAEVDKLVDSEEVQASLVGRSPGWLAVVRQIVEVARFTQAPVLITGESGTGKELAARLVHTLDGRSGKRDLVVLDCSTLVASLSGSEFFGHERGAFTGAVNARDGAFALADGGTLFLDEVGELPLELQPQLLRAVQEHTYKRVGGNVWKNVQFRLVCATNRDLQAEVAAGRFRADVYYRIAGVCCHLPPLRDRIPDVPLLTEHFLRELSPGSPVRSVDAPVLSWLLQREYKNNVRELRLVLARMLHRHAGPGPISVGDIPLSERPEPATGTKDWRDGFTDGVARAVAAGAGLKEIGRAAEDIAEQIALEQGGSVAAAAARLGVSDRALQMRRALRRDRTQANGTTQKSA
jgi:transcriptional regulator with GAF, ATPase, and Fis domain